MTNLKEIFRENDLKKKKSYFNWEKLNILSFISFMIFGKILT